jgi:hypothetical protein
MPCPGFGLLVSLAYLAAACDFLGGVPEWLATTRKPSQGHKLIQAVASNLAFFLTGIDQMQQYDTPEVRNTRI